MESSGTLDRPGKVSGGGVTEKWIMEKEVMEEGAMDEIDLEKRNAFL